MTNLYLCSEFSYNVYVLKLCSMLYTFTFDVCPCGLGPRGCETRDFLTDRAYGLDPFIFLRDEGLFSLLFLQ